MVYDYWTYNAIPYNIWSMETVAIQLTLATKPRPGSQLKIKYFELGYKSIFI